MTETLRQQPHLSRQLAARDRAIPDIVADRVVEQHRVLRHDRNRLAQCALLDARNVLPVNEDAALLSRREKWWTWMGGGWGVVKKKCRGSG